MKHYIYYGQYSGFSLASWIIRLFTWSKTSHTSCFFPPINGQWNMVIEAWRKGVTSTMWTENHRKGTKIKIYRIPCTRQQKETYYAVMKSLVGKKYDFPGVTGFLFRKKIQRVDKWFCSESVFYSMLQADFVPLARIKPYQVAPALMTIIPTAEFVDELIVP